MKKFFYILVVLFMSFEVKAIIFQNEQFDADFCQNGYAAPWVGACICEESLTYAGRYCDMPTNEVCRQNKECSREHFCLQTEAKGMCVSIYGRGPLAINGMEFVLSDMLLNYKSAENFCASLGKKYRQATRKDFMCDDIGPGCLDTEKIIELQKMFGTIGFFWLEAKDDNIAFYADINDGTVYETSKQNIKTLQALCVKGE